MTEISLASRLRGLRSSAIRDLLALTQRPEVLSLAGGIPDTALLPRVRLADAASRVLESGDALQYATTEGDPRLRALIADRAGATPDQVLVTHGSQQALDVIARGLLEPGDVVVVEAPAYLGALQVLALAEADVRQIPVDGDGLDVDALTTALDAGLRPRLVYVVANFSNPSGVTLSEARRRALAALADRYGFLIVEDDPYGSLRFRKQPVPSTAAFTDMIIRLGSTSKVLAPGARVGWMVGPAEIVSHLVRIKQATDLHSSSLAQALVVDLLSDPTWFDAHVAELCAVYGERADALVTALQAEFGDRIALRVPDGGMFCWFDVPGADTTAALPVAIERGVAYVPGAAFYVDGGGSSQLRCSFATLDPDGLREAVRRLGPVFGR